MSAPASSERRRPGIGRAVLAVCLNPLLGLVNQALILAADPWMCVHQQRWTSFALPAVCVVLIALLSTGAYRSWLEARHAGDGALASAERFLGLLGMALGVLAATFLIAQSAAAVTFPPCAI